jgi:glutathione synthase/RimK-type ligase-like ATP-grasp enzyme
VTVSRRPSVALATAAGWPDLAPDDRLLPPALARLGVDSTVAVWTDPAVPWGNFDAIVVRSCWDYHDDLPRWLAWIEALERAGLGPRLWNPPAVLRWNSSKTYLADLAGGGVPVVPTRFLSGPELASWPALRATLEATGFDDVVCKPAVSAGAFGTFRLRRGQLDADAAAAELAAALPELARRGPLLVQPFLPEVAQAGEWSLLYFAGELHHAVVKRPAAGDFRVQEKHGGRTTAAPPPAELVAVAAQALAAATRAIPGPAPPPDPLLYARVDLVVSGGRPWLMELEVLEPALFLAASNGTTAAGTAADRFAAAILGKIVANLRKQGDLPAHIA